ncbi:DPP IV N-terminal domain-containing protein [Acidobacteriota bacterium]
MKRILLIFIVLSIAALPATSELKKLTFEQAYQSKGEKLTKRIPYFFKWADNEHYYRQKEGKLFKVHAVSGKSSVVLDPEKYGKLSKEGFSLLGAADRTPDLRKFVFVKKGDIFLFLKKKKKIIRITKTETKETNPEFSPDGNKIAFTTENNLYCYNIKTGKTQQLTTDGSVDILNGYASWVYYEEILGRRGGYKAFWWSPDSTKIVFMRFDQGKVPIFPIVRAEGTYSKLENQRYPKPGFPNPQVRIGFADLKTGALEWIAYEDPKDHYLTFPDWNETADKIYFQWMNRDQNHLKLLVYDLPTKKIATLYDEKQKAWVEFLDTGDFYLLKNGDVVLRSSKDGWYHIYYLDKNGEVKPVTTGEWTVTGIKNVDQVSKTIYFSAKKEDSTESDYYKTDFMGEKIVKLTENKGSHRVTVAPSGKYFIDNYSSIQTPTRLELRDNNSRLIREIADSATPTLKEYDLGKVEMFRITTDDGYKLPARWLLPPNFNKNRKYPVIFSIYGGPGSSSVSNSYPRLSHFFLAQNDIIVLSVDHRGSGHFGKKGIDLMHRCLGKWEMHDYSQAVKYLRTLPFVDGEKIGITGGSYGGYAAALALTKASDYFNCGIAGASVIDWRFYDSVYTERYMDTPEQNPEGYKNSSVLSYIDGYRCGSIRITHGTMDDNVHMQNTIQFIEKVLNAGKSLELMLYPGDRHGYSGNKRLDSNRAGFNFWMRKFYPRRNKNVAQTL